MEQQIVEVFVRLLRDRQGAFTFVAGVTPSGLEDGASHPFDVSEIIAQARAHLDEWRRIESLVPDPFASFQVSPELPTEKFEVTLDARKWMFLSAMGERASIDEVAERLGIFEFPAAMAVAELVREGLVVPVASGRAATMISVTTSFEPADAAPTAAPEAASPTIEAPRDLSTPSHPQASQASPPAHTHRPPEPGSPAQEGWGPPNGHDDA